MIDFYGSSVYGYPELLRKLDIVEKSPVFPNSTINFSNLSDNEFPEWVLIYLGILKDSSSANSHG
jgi:hypothetical protein